MKSFIQIALDLVPEYIQRAYPKGDEERGKATVHIVIFLQWLLMNQIKK